MIITIIIIIIIIINIINIYIGIIGKTDLNRLGSFEGEKFLDGLREFVDHCREIREDLDECWKVFGKGKNCLDAKAFRQACKRIKYEGTY